MTNTQNDGTYVVSLNTYLDGLTDEDDIPTETYRTPTPALTPVAYDTTYAPADGSTINVTAHRGTQYVSVHTGAPTDATVFGTFYLDVRDRNGNTARITIDDEDDADAIISVLGAARQVARSRDINNDQPIGYTK